MKWTIIAGEGVRYRCQRRRVRSQVTPSGHVLWRDGSSAWAPVRRRTEEYAASWNGPKSPFPLPFLCSAAVRLRWIFLPNLLSGLEWDMIIHIICPVSDSFAAVTAPAWQQPKIQHLLNSGPGNWLCSPPKLWDLLRRFTDVLPSGCLGAVKDGHLGSHAGGALSKKLLKTKFWISLRTVLKCKICALKSPKTNRKKSQLKTPKWLKVLMGTVLSLNLK